MSEEIKSLDELDKLYQEKFYLDMQDNWTSEDFAYAKKLNSEIAKLEKVLAIKTIEENE